MLVVQAAPVRRAEALRPRQRSATRALSSSAPNLATERALHALSSSPRVTNHPNPVTARRPLRASQAFLLPVL